MSKRGVFPRVVAGCVAVVSAVSVAQATDIAWNVDADGNWADSAGWLPVAVPGVGDTAVFNYPLTAGRTVTVDANRTIGGISFGSTNEFAFTLAGGNLLLKSGGIIQNLADTGAHIDLITSPIAIQGDGGAATFSANSASNSVLAIDANVSGVSTSGKTTKLTLTGANVNADEHRVSGIISDGSEGGKLSVTKSGINYNTWVVSGANTFSGGVDIQGGVLIVEHDAALGSGSVVQSPEATLALRGGITVTGKTLVLGGGTKGTHGSLDGFGGTNTWAGNVTFAGAGPRLNCADGTLIITGNVEVNSASGNPTIGGFGKGEFRGVISGPSNKVLFRSSTDTGTWSLLGTNTFLGTVTCANGTVEVNNDKSLGARTSISAVGLTLGGAATRGTLRTLADVVLSSFYGVTLHGGGGMFRTDAGTSLTVNGIIVNRTATPNGTLLKTGAGRLVLNAKNTFSTMLEVSEGTVVLGQAQALDGLAGTRPKLKVDATLDLGSYSIATPELSGAGGTISNGTLSVTAATLLGGDGAVAALALPATTLAGTLTADVAIDGTCDHLNVAGALTLNNVALAIADITKLRTTQVYTLVQCVGGSVIGEFSSDNLPDNWNIKYLGDRIVISYFGGMIMTVR